MVSHGKIVGDHPAFLNAQKLLKDILDLVDLSVVPLQPHGGEEQTEKYLLLTEDGLEIEMVVLPMRAGWTLCVSSQIGCRMACAFCETGRMGLIRHLSVPEILSQIFQARHQLGVPIRNLVFMGMGEPLDNYDALLQSLKVLTDPHGFGFGPRHITVSTSGLVDPLYRFLEEADPGIHLAVSVNAPSDECATGSCLSIVSLI